MVGAVLVRDGRILGQGWHQRAGGPHAEIMALDDARRRGERPDGATLYVTLEPCSTHGRTPPCTEALIAAQLHRVVVATTDPNPRHAGRGLERLRRAGLEVHLGPHGDAATRLNEAFNHWIVHRTPFVTLKAAMTLDGKIATARGESKWITGPASRVHAHHLRSGSDAILVGVNTVLADDPALTVRIPDGSARRGASTGPPQHPRRIILDSRARTPLAARVVSDAFADRTTIFVARHAPARRVAALARRVAVVPTPTRGPRLSLRWILRRLGKADVTHLLVEGGGEVLASFLEQGLAHRVAFFYAPKVLGGKAARPAVAGTGFVARATLPRLAEIEWRSFGEDLFLTARLSSPGAGAAGVGLA
jgi:diaminohydroxyphosphoribosylaminopyrimidine deaminase/5-amino-6-(5-phosphoribosylamino)uracil reductase